jgi:kynurenine 3-monooxygenase
MNQKDQKVKLIGAGLNGPLLGLELVKRGFDVEIFERRPDMRRVNMSAGRSINLALSTRGIHALKNAGVWSQMEKIIVPMKGRMMHSVAGELTFQRYGKNDSEVINSISRADLGVALMNAAEAAGVKVSFQQRCTGIDFGNGALLLRDEASATDRQI